MKYRVKNEPAELGELGRKLAGKTVQLKQHGPVASRVIDPGPPPKEWLVANKLLEKHDGPSND